MTNRLKDKIALVTAAGQGIGKATAIAFHNEGAKVIATDINEKTLLELNKEYPKIDVKTLDSTDNNSIKDQINKFERIDVLFNAVGFVHHGTILECDEKDWDFSFNVNIKSMYFMCKSVLPIMLKNNGGSILFFSSSAAKVGLSNHEAIASSKGAINSLVVSAASTYAKYNIRLNSISPGLVKTNLTKNIVENEASLKFSTKLHALGRIGKPENFIPIVQCLLDPNSDWITGQNFNVDGGLSNLK